MIRKQEIHDALGEKVFSFYYEFLYKHRVDPSTDEAKMRKKLNEMIGSNKTLRKLIFDLEQIIFIEVQEQAQNIR